MFSPELLFPFSPEFGFHFFSGVLGISEIFCKSGPQPMLFVYIYSAVCLHHQNVTLENRLLTTTVETSFQTTEMKISHFSWNHGPTTKGRKKFPLKIVNTTPSTPQWFLKFFIDWESFIQSIPRRSGFDICTFLNKKYLLPWPLVTYHQVKLECSEIHKKMSVLHAPSSTVARHR